jgi:hypothetical protein
VIERNMAVVDAGAEVEVSMYHSQTTSTECQRRRHYQVCPPGPSLLLARAWSLPMGPSIYPSTHIPLPSDQEIDPLTIQSPGIRAC